MRAKSPLSAGYDGMIASHSLPFYRLELSITDNARPPFGNSARTYTEASLYRWRVIQMILSRKFLAQKIVLE